jgi:hypothetical protein
MLISPKPATQKQTHGAHFCLFEPFLAFFGHFLDCGAKIFWALIFQMALRRKTFSLRIF